MMLGALFAVLSSATFALNGVSVRRGVLTGSVAQAMAITVPMGVPIFFVVALATGGLGALFEFSGKTLMLLSLAGIFHFVWGRYCNYRATKAIGSNAVTPLQQLDFPLKLGLAIVFLGETLTPLSLIGIGLIFLGGAVAIKRRKKRVRRTETPTPALATASTVGAAAVADTSGNTDAAKAQDPARPVFVPHYFEGYLFALLSITGYGVSPLFIRMALQDAGLGASLAGGLVSYIAATLVIVAMMMLPGRFAHIRSMNTVSAKWFAASSIFVGVSQIFRYMALAIAPVTVVATIMRAAGLFKLVFNWFVNRQYESFEPRLIVGIFISIAGGLAMTLSPEFVAANVPLPGSVTDLLGWRWP